MTTLLVTGGREYLDYEHVAQTLTDVATARRVTCVVHGDAQTGVDALTSLWCDENKMLQVKFPVTPENWRRWGNRAGNMRNSEMLRVSKPDIGLVFPGGTGTHDMLTKLEDATNVETIRVKGPTT